MEKEFRLPYDDDGEEKSEDEKEDEDEGGDDDPPDIKIDTILAKRGLLFSFCFPFVIPFVPPNKIERKRRREREKQQTAAMRSETMERARGETGVGSVLMREVKESRSIDPFACSTEAFLSS